MVGDEPTISNSDVKSAISSLPMVVGAEDRLAKLLALPLSKGRCKGVGSPAHLRSVDRPQREIVVKFACKSWRCRVCSARLREVYGMHFGLRLLHSEGFLYSETSEPLHWARDKKRLQRAGSEWVRIGSLRQVGFLLVCEPARGCRAYSDREEAVKQLGRALRELKAEPPGSPRDRFRPVANSPGWRRPKRVRRYERVGWVSVPDPSAVVDRLKAVGIERAVIKTRCDTDTLWDVVFECPPDKRPLVELALAG